MTPVTLRVDPDTFEIGSREDLTITFNAAPALNPGDTIVAGTPELVRLSDGVNYTAGLFGSPAVDGQLIAQEVRDLEAGERYALILPFTSLGETFAPMLTLIVPRP